MFRFGYFLIAKSKHMLVFGQKSGNNKNFHFIIPLLFPFYYSLSKKLLKSLKFRPFEGVRL